MSEDQQAARIRALVEEACRKSAMVWLQPVDAARAIAAWHVWVDGAAYVVGGGLEQTLPEMPDGSRVDVTVRSKDKGGRLVTWTAVADRVAPGDPAYEAAVTELHAKRLNPPDGEAQPARWERESDVIRLQPTGELSASPSNMPSRSHAAEPARTPATTRGPLPFVLGRRARRRR